MELKGVDDRRTQEIDMELRHFNQRIAKWIADEDGKPECAVKPPCIHFAYQQVDELRSERAANEAEKDDLMAKMVANVSSIRALQAEYMKANAAAGGATDANNEFRYAVEQHKMRCDALESEEMAGQYYRKTVDLEMRLGEASGALEKALALIKGCADAGLFDEARARQCQQVMAYSAFVDAEPQEMLDRFATALKQPVKVGGRAYDDANDDVLATRYAAAAATGVGLATAHELKSSAPPPRTPDLRRATSPTAGAATVAGAAPDRAAKPPTPSALTEACANAQQRKPAVKTAVTTAAAGGAALEQVEPNVRPRDGKRPQPAGTASNRRRTPHANVAAAMQGLDAIAQQRKPAVQTAGTTGGAAPPPRRHAANSQARWCNARPRNDSALRAQLCVPEAPTAVVAKRPVRKFPPSPCNSLTGSRASSHSEL